MRVAVALAALALAGCSKPAGTDEAPAKAGRFTIISMLARGGDNAEARGVWRLDTQTGALDACEDTQAVVTCSAANYQ